MKRRAILAVMAMVLGFNLYSQVRDVSLTVSPYAEYMWWNDKTTLDNTAFWGARAGFSFGPLFELRGFYQKSADIEANLRKLDWSVTDDWADKMTQTHIDVSRYGGEMKMNLMNNRVFAPYLTLGGGVQRLTFEVVPEELVLKPYDVKEEQLFATVGLGTKFNLTDRIVLSLEAKHTVFNVNDKSYYLSSDYDIAEGETKRLGNWSAVASLDFYLGGSKMDKNEVHRAYEKMFSDGFSGMKFVVEPGVAYIKLKDDALFEEQYFVGGTAGIDFSSLVGLRGFYYKATEEPGKLALNFNNKMEMYGGNLIARLNQPRGINPYLQLGGGYIKTSNKYMNHLGEVGDLSRPFAMGGVGLEIPLSQYVALYGSANAMLTNEGSDNIASLEKPKQVKTDWMYQAGVRFNFGKSVDADAYYQKKMSRALMSEREYANEQINLMREEYELRIDMLTEELERAVEENDYDKVVKIQEERRAVEKELREVHVAKDDERIEPKVEAKVDEPKEYIKLTADELSRIVRETVKETRQEYENSKVGQRMDVEPMESGEQARAQQTVVPAKTKAADKQDDASSKASDNEQLVADRLTSIEAGMTDNMDRQFEVLNRVIEEQSVEIAQQSDEIATLKKDIMDEAARQVAGGVAAQSSSRSDKAKVTTKKEPFMKLRGVSAYGAADLGSKTYGNIGLRGHWRMKESNFELMPEIYMAFGKKNGFGISANVVYSFGDKFAPLRPYAGLGVGGFPGNKTVWGTNVIGGVAYDIKIGELFTDLSIRNLFRQNQWTVGYRVSF